MREEFYDRCAAELRVYYDYDCSDQEGDIYVRAHMHNNWKQLLSKEKSRANERIKLSKSLGYTNATRRMVRPHYYNEAAWQIITKHWESEKFEKASINGKKNRDHLKFGHKSGAIPFCVRRSDLDSKLESPMTDLEFFKHVYNIDEPTIKNIMEGLEAASSCYSQYS